MTAAERDRAHNHATRSRVPSPEPPRRPHRSVRAHEAGGASDYGRGARHYDRGASHYDGGRSHYDGGAVTMTTSAHHGPHASARRPAGCAMGERGREM
jgi:hypothetical protein